MSIDGKRILERLSSKEKDKKGPVTLYVSKATYAEFQRKCGDLSASEVAEELMREFNATVPEPRAGKK